MASIVALGMLGGSLIVAQSGFSTSSKHGAHSVFVPAPEAYLMAAAFFCMSVIGMVALIRTRSSSVLVIALSVVVYVAVAVLVTSYLRQN